MKKTNKKINPLKKVTIKNYQTRARKGDLTAIRLLKQHGIEIQLDPKKGGRPRQGIKRKESTQKQYFRAISANLKKEKETFKNPFGYNEKIFKFKGSKYSVAEIKKAAKDPFSKSSEGIVEELKDYRTNSKKFFSSRVEDIRQAWKDSTFIYKNKIDLLTDEEVIQFYNSIYFVYLEDDEFSSDGLKFFYEMNGQTLQIVRLKDFCSLNNIDLAQRESESKEKEEE